MMPAKEALTIRVAHAGEASALTELAVRSKAHWKYSPAFLDRARFDLEVSERDIERGLVIVAEHAATTLGFYRLDESPDTPELMALFVEPGAIGMGIGRSLFEHAARACRARGARHMIIQSDPFAEPFYLSMGAERVGEMPSPVDGTRMLPLLHFRL